MGSWLVTKRRIIRLILTSFLISFLSIPVADAATVIATGTDPTACNQTVDITAYVVAYRLAGGQCVVEFKNVGTTTWQVPTGITSAQVMVVAGGGSGGGLDWTGGGGAGGAGAAPASSRSGNGGAGLSSDISGSTVFYAGGGGGGYGGGRGGGGGGYGGGGRLEGAAGGNDGNFRSPHGVGGARNSSGSSGRNEY